MKRLFVWVRGPEGTVSLAGELAITDPVAGGRFETEFEYSREWLSHPEAFALDPASLPLQPPGRRYRSEQLHRPLAVFDDALPDDWGRGLLVRALKSEGRKSSPAEMLLRPRGARPLIPVRLRVPHGGTTEGGSLGVGRQGSTERC